MVKFAYTIVLIASTSNDIKSRQFEVMHKGRKVAAFWSRSEAEQWIERKEAKP